MTEKRKTNKLIERKMRGVILAYMEVVSLSLQFHGRVGLAYAGCHVRPLAKSCKSGVYVSGGTSYLSCSYGSCIPHPGGAICHGVLGVL
jgi:hypothetical protein